jgi:uncharacterized protein YyaL (SSP411 family)
MERPTNRLIHSRSLYLRQQAFNPVDWYEWGEEALQRARNENKPMLVSIGYSSCHWCHVMERECFEDHSIAQVMNTYFICIKVDREERPDIDQVYMDAVQAMGLQGGWPLNVFLTPDGQPFFGGTYFPPRQWMQILKGIAHAWENSKDEVLQSAAQLTEFLKRSPLGDATAPTKELPPVKPDHTFQLLEKKVDNQLGGLAKAPKFIMPSVWLWLMRYHYLTHNPAALRHLTFSLHHIAAGGIYDHVGGGFARYATDEAWRIPHFEKMLYDNAQLLQMYSEAWTITRQERFRQTALGIITWLNCEMSHPAGGFYTAIDADSEGEEGKFYTWTMDEWKEALGSEAGKWADFYHVTEAGNWEEGRNILYRKPYVDDPPELQAINARLLNHRDQRPRPVCDTKMVTAWNALTISALTHAFRAFGDEALHQRAVQAMHFLLSHLSDGTKLFRSYAGESLPLEGFLDDYACVIQACIDLHQITLEEHWLERAALFTEKVLRDFSDEGEPFFYYTASTAETLIVRKKELFDNVIPSSNSIMAENLLVLGRLLDRTEWLNRAHAMLSALQEVIQNEPVYMSNWGKVLLRTAAPACEVVISGAGEKDLLKELQQAYHPFVLFARASASGLIPLAAEKSHPHDDASHIFVCINNTCFPPVVDPEEALSLIGRMHQLQLQKK